MIAVARSIHFASAMLLFGSLLLALAVAKPLWRNGVASPRAQRLFRLARLCAGWTIAASLASGALWLVADAAIMSGEPWNAVVRDGTLGLVLRSTTFGHLWLWRLGLIVALTVLLFLIGRPSRPLRRIWLGWAALAVAAAYLGSLSWSGHAAAAQASGDYVQVVSDVVHLLAAGAWVGALPGLVLLLGSRESPGVAAHIVRRFSTLGVISVGLVIASGLGNTWYLVGSVPALIGTDYGRVLLAKLALFAVMLVLAAVNRVVLTARLEHGAAEPALRALRRNATLETIAGGAVIAMAGVLGVMVPGAHQSPVWPFDRTLSGQAAQQSLSVGVTAAALGVVTVLATWAAARAVFQQRWRHAAAASAMLAAAVAAGAWLLAVPAYPTTYAMAPVRYTTAVIAEGARLYSQNCAACHGQDARGDGPLAAALPILPTDVAAHAAGHRVGDLFWWIAHGIPGTPMPAFAPRLHDDEIWDLVQFLRAESDAVEAASLTTRVEPWRAAIMAPDFSFERKGKGQQSLRQTGDGGATLLVLYTAPQSLPYLRALAEEAPNFGEIGLRVVALPLSAGAGPADDAAGGESVPITASADRDAIAAYAMLARQDGGAPGAMPVQVDYLIDRQGYVRARWIGVPDSPLLRAAEVFDQAELLRRERRRAPAAMTHPH